MLNTYRQFDILIFYTPKELSIGETLVKSGWNQMVRKDNFYFLRNLTNSNFYTQFSTSLGHLLAAQLFKQE